MMYLVNKENKDAISLADKLYKQAHPGALIEVTKAELDAFRYKHLIELPDPPWPPHPSKSG